MGKVSSGWIGGDEEDDPDEKRRKLRRELDQVRKNALGRKRELRKDSIIHKPKSNLMRTLNQFASQRRKIEDATQINNLLNKPRIIKQEVIQPRELRGFFAAGIKGREITRPDPVYEKYKKAVLQNDPLQLLQSTIYHRPEEKPHKSTKSPIEDDHAELKMEVSKILNNFHSSESSFDLDEPGTIEFPSSPVIGRYKGAKKKVNQVRAPANEEHRNLHPREKEVPFVNNVNKEERFRRRLFDADIVDVNNKHNEVVNNAMHNHGASRKSTPENVIFYSKVVSKELVNNNNKKRSKIDHLCADPDVINYYVKICKFFGQNELKDMFRDKYKDPEEKAKEALKSTYKRSLKEFFDRQNCQTKTVDNQTTPSSNTEVLLEPDSAIARVVKKNVAFLKQKQSSASNSTDSTKNFVSKVDAQIHNSSIVNTVENNIAKRKRVPSSKGSEPEVPSSTQAIADPRSVRAESKMNMIDPYRQEIVARFLEDQKNYNSEASQQVPERHVRKEKLYISNDSDGTYMMQKSTKYIPAILRRNRSLADCIEKEKAILSIEKYPSQRNHKSSMLDIDLDNIESEHTPNTVIEPLMEAPKCKYAHANAKYNQPSRINIPIVQDNRHHRNPVPDRYSHRAPSPEKSFTLSQPYQLSPIKHYSSYADAGHDYHHFQASQESQHSDTGNCMTRMVSFGDIQDRTNRLTLCSQNQPCSQESMDHAYASQRNCHYQPCESTSNCYQQNQQPRREPTYCNRANRPAATYVPPQNEYCNCGCCRQEPTRQPIKFHAAEGNRRQPIYQPNEPSCSYAHKQPCCSSDSSDFEYLDMLKMNYGDRPQSFVAPPNGNQRYVVQRQMPASPPPAVCQQVAHRHGHRAANEACKMNEAILHHMNRQMHSKRQ